MDTRSCIPIGTTRTGDLRWNGSYGSGIAFSQGVEEGSLGEVDDITTTLHYVKLHSSNAARPMKMLEDASLR
jgi:hypothetical protein